MFSFLLFLHFHSCSLSSPSLSFISSTLSSISSPFLWETTQNDPQGLTRRKTQHNQILISPFVASGVLCFVIVAFVFVLSVFDRILFMISITKICLYNFDPLKLLYRKTGVYRGIHYFSYFCSKHRLWVLVRTASPRRFQRVSTIYVLSRNMKTEFFLSKNYQLLEVKILYIFE